ncbi:hypothetical protein BGW37DRAFT_524644 [Umbelopsis sp. PMI_123]|nr:hypothetical protein BGW37DRAFT_524644 [Umbelopsis sp. PMI_123]
MPDDDRILKSLQLEFKPMDRKYAQGELRVFGRNSTQILNELDKIRRKQINLATEHISLDGVVDNSHQDVTNDEDHEGGYQKNVDNFQKREANLINLMDKLDDLGQMMKQFHSLSNSVIAQGDVLTDFSANDSISTEKGADDLQGSLPVQNGISQRYNSMDTVIAPSMQNLLNDSDIPTQTSRNSLLQNSHITAEVEDIDANNSMQAN